MTTTTSRTTGDVYAAYEEIVRKVEGWVGQVNPTVPGCVDRHVRARVVQRVLEISEAEVTRQLRLGAVPRRCSAGGLTIDTETGRVRVSLRLCLINVAIFVAAWSEGLLGLLRALVSAAPSRPGTATILMEGGGGFERSDARFAEFCAKGPVAPLSGAATLVVQSRQAPQTATDPRLVYTRRPLLGLVDHVLNRGARLAVLGQHLLAPVLYVRVLAAAGVSVLISRDVALVPAFRWLDRHRIVDALVATTSFFAGQPLWMIGLAGQRYKLHMIWYSQNFIPKMYVGDTARPNLPAARHMRADVHWVWTQGFKDYLRELGTEAECHVVGPLLWYLPAPVDGIDPAAINIAVFDITPLPDGETAFGAARNYYSVACMSKFVSDIVSVAGQLSTSTGRPVHVLLKHKRAPKQGRHDFTYVDLLDDTARRFAWFRLVDHETNLFGFLDKCDLSVSVPYTSTAYVGAHLGRPALYYDPDAELVPRFEAHPLVRFASGAENLATLIQESVGTWPKP